MNDSYEVHDIHVRTTDGRNAEGSVMFSVNGGDLFTSSFIYSRTGGLVFSDRDLHQVRGLVGEVLAEVEEAAAYQRDLNKEKN